MDKAISAGLIAQAM